MPDNYVLPEIVTLTEYNGDFKVYFESIYQIFKRDFVESKPIYNSKPIRLKQHPYIDGKEYTFYHFTHSGNIESDRKPDLRRMERIAWAKPVIEQCENWELKVWPQKRNGKNRICIWLQLQDDFDYVVILDVRDSYVLPWTAFVLQYNHEKNKKQKEFESYLKSKNRLKT